jgi:soluble lytic murein transglycosylase-like protein
LRYFAAAAYNTGENNIRRHIQNQEITDYYHMHLPEETMRYVFRILALKTIFENPISYGIMLREKDLYPQIPVKSVVVDTTITNLFAFARQQGTTYQQLKSLNPWLRNNNLPNKSGKKYEISVPLNTSLLRDNLHIRDNDENILQEFEN